MALLRSLKLSSACFVVQQLLQCSEWLLKGC